MKNKEYALHDGSGMTFKLSSSIGEFIGILTMDELINAYHVTYVYFELHKKFEDIMSGIDFEDKIDLDIIREVNSDSNIELTNSYPYERINNFLISVKKYLIDNLNDDELKEVYDNIHNTLTDELLTRYLLYKLLSCENIVFVGSTLLEAVDDIVDEFFEK